MEIRHPAEPIPDPFFAAVRRRHPDVDVVLLPPPDPPGTVADVTDEAVVGALVRVATTADRLWSRLAAGGPERPETRCGFGADPSSVRAVARATARRGDGGEALDRLRRELEHLGLRHSRVSGVERLTGAVDGLDLAATYAEGAGALALAVWSESLPVGAARASELTRARGGRGGDR